MARTIISYINEHIGANYSDMLDFFKDLKYNPPEYNVNYLCNLLLIIESMEMEELDEPELTQDQVDNYLYKRNLVAVDAMMVHQLGKKEEQ